MTTPREMLEAVALPELPGSPHSLLALLDEIGEYVEACRVAGMDIPPYQVDSWINRFRAIAPQSALAHSRAQDSGGEAKSPSLNEILPERHPYPEPDPDTGADRGSCCEHAYADGWNHCLDAINEAAEQPAKGEGVPAHQAASDAYRAGFADGQASQQPFDASQEAAPTSHTADAVQKWSDAVLASEIGLAAKNDDGSQERRAWLGTLLEEDRRRKATPPTAQRHDEGLPTMEDAIAAGDGTLHGAIEYWQERALRAEATHGAGAAVEAVDDAMVERACAAYLGETGTAFHWKNAGEEWRAGPRIMMRRALEAALSTQPLPQLAGVSDDAAALDEFTEYFVRNYPGPNTIICDPNWHAPRIFRAAKRALHPEQAKDGETG